MSRRRESTTTSAFGVGRRESHDSSRFYARFTPPTISADSTVAGPPLLDDPCVLGDARNMTLLPDNSVALVVTSPPYFVGKEYEDAVRLAGVDADSGGGERFVPSSYGEYLDLLHHVFADCVRVLEPGGRMAINVANLGRKPYRSLAADVTAILESLGLLLRGEIIWQKARGASGSCAWGSFASPANPVLRDTTERVIVASKGRFDRALSAAERRRIGLPWEATISNDEFVAATLDVWEIGAESARRVKHPAPFPVELPLKLIELYTYAGDAVLDPLMGSGTTLVAAAAAGRVPLGYDNDPDYVAIARSRLDERPRADAAGNGSAPVVPGRKGALSIAKQQLESAGFTVVRKGPTLRGTGTSFTFLVAGRTGREFYVEVPGGFTTSKPGLERMESVWKILGQANVLRRLDPERRLLVLSPAMARPRSKAAKTLRAVGPDGLFDVIELDTDAGRRRLEHYATSSDSGPIHGFWTSADLTPVQRLW